ncbi:hypothetical protein [Entomomonas asaccharolytica]|uniref:Uncharacterized protein n=1 Tax=Entomomonas asaccharolytica TaxID=2785331 RepID=A0A974NDL2_9GAMM|nr:hypothetical protein [Entomomonas asaccharolytica]QQP84736.1 hypothetical protein JHT90_09985 [Entomomonas asaccharolytica]
MLNGQISYDLALPSNNTLDNYITEQVKQLLTTCSCPLVAGKDYELEVAAQAVNGLINEYETADVYLYAAIERQDWQEVTRLYQMVFRPSIYQVAYQAVINIMQFNKY